MALSLQATRLFRHAPLLRLGGPQGAQDTQLVYLAPHPRVLKEFDKAPLRKPDIVLLSETPFERHPCEELTFEFTEGNAVER